MRRHLLALLFLCGCFTGCLNAQTTNVKELEAVLTNGNVQLVDVRSEEEFSEAHIREAVLMDVNDDSFEKKIEVLDKTRPVYVYCRSGRRSSKAAAIMKEKGFAEVVELEGGLNAWTEAGKPTETSPAR